MQGESYPTFTLRSSSTPLSSIARRGNDPFRLTHPILTRLACTTPLTPQGYITSPDDVTMTPVTTWSAGGTYNYTVAGSATHGGGSCQLVMSYDYGQTWQVIFSYIGGCMVEGSTTEFTLPADAPNGEAMFGWNWFNRVGNREMYQNCAVVTITNGGGGLSPSVYPVPFVANAGVNGCSTVEGQDPVFPEPGPNVRYGGAYAGGNAQSGLGITGSNCYGPGQQGGSTPAGSGSGPGSASSAGAASGSASATAAASSSVAGIAPSVSSAAWAEPTAPALSAAWGESASAEPTASSQGGRGDGQDGEWWQGGRPSGAPSAWDGEPTASQSRIGYEHAAQPSASSAAAPAASSSAGKTCRRRKRAIPLLPGHGHAPVEARHERFITRRMYEEAERRAAFTQQAL